MNRQYKYFTAGLLAVIGAGILITGCTTATIPVEVSVPGEFNLSGVSKIALVDFNSMPDDPLAGIQSADKETLTIVQRAVSSSFYKSKMYHVANLDIEKEIKAQQSSKLEQRFDAVIYGRVWWQTSPEYCTFYPKVFNLESWSMVPYTQNGVTSKVRVTDRTKDEIGTLSYRAWNANLMLTLTLYRLDGNGMVEKITEKLAVANQEFTLDNGELKVQYTPIGMFKEDRASRLQAASKKEESIFSVFNKKDEVKDVSGKVKLAQNSRTIPTELQAKIMLSEQLAGELGKKFTPSKVVFDIPSEFGDKKLYNLMKDGAFRAAKDYIAFTVRTKLGNKVTNKIADEVVYLSNVPPYLVPQADADESDDAIDDAVVEYRDYFYALAICEEATGQYEESLNTYRYLFARDPDLNVALGISRCLFALGMKDRIKEKEKAKSSAEKKSGLN